MTDNTVSFKFSSEHEIKPEALKQLIDDKYARLRQQLHNERELRTRLKHYKFMK